MSSDKVVEPARNLTLALKAPIEVAGGHVSELALREPTGAEMREAERAFDDGYTPETESLFEQRLICAVAGVGEEVTNALPVTVMRQARAFVAGFDGPTPRPDPLPDELDIDLPGPVKSGGIEYVTLTLREPTVGMRRRAETALRGGRLPANQRQYQLVLVAQVSGVPFGVIEKLPVSALNAAEAYLMGFIQPGRPAGSA